MVKKQQQDKIEVIITEELKKYLESAFSPFFERGFLIFEKNGVLCKAVESTKPNSPRSFGFDHEHNEEIIKSMSNEGYRFVGTYHHHLDSDVRTLFRRSPPKGSEHYNLGELYNPNHPSPDDLGAWNRLAQGKIGQETIERKEQFLLLGHQSETIPFHIRCYSRITDLPENHPWRTQQVKLTERGLLLEHYYTHHREKIIDHPIIFLNSGDIDPTAERILQKYKLSFKRYRIKFKNGVIITGLLKHNQLDWIEVVTKDFAKRYLFNENGEVRFVGIYGDCRTETRTKWITDKERLKIEQRKVDPLKKILEKKLQERARKPIKPTRKAKEKVRTLVKRPRFK